MTHVEAVLELPEGKAIAEEQILPGNKQVSYATRHLAPPTAVWIEAGGPSVPSADMGFVLSNVDRHFAHCRLPASCTTSDFSPLSAASTRRATWLAASRTGSISRST